MNASFLVGEDISRYKVVLSEAWKKKPGNLILVDPFFLKCTLDENIILVFNIIIGKLAKLSYVNNYDKEVIKKIKIGMSIKEISKSNALSYNEDENFYSLVTRNDIALFFKNPYQSILENPENKLEEITFFDENLLKY